MIEVVIRAGTARYPIRIGAGLLQTLGPALLELALVGKVALIADAEALGRWGEPVSRSLREAGLFSVVIEVAPGEASKSFEGASAIYGRLIEAGMGRGDTIVSLGGGVVGDLAGFVAATYHRGIAYVQLPTTLLAQVDASVGGKVAVDHPLGKNLIGAFHQPRLVLADTASLTTLPPRQRWSGLAEVVKAALIADEAFLARLEGELEPLAEDEAGPDRLAEVIARAVEIKAAVVGEDERDLGLRRILNFGHTVGHALELGAGFGTITHGEAVVQGMKAAVSISRRLELLGQAEAERASRLLARFPEPPPFPRPSRDEILAAMGRDKKAEGGALRFVVLEGLGRARIIGGVPTPILDAAIDLALET